MTMVVVVYWIDGEPDRGETKAVIVGMNGIDGMDDYHCTGGVVS